MVYTINISHSIYHIWYAIYRIYISCYITHNGISHVSYHMNAISHGIYHPGGYRDTREVGKQKEKELPRRAIDHETMYGPTVCQEKKIFRQMAHMVKSFRIRRAMAM